MRRPLTLVLLLLLPFARAEAQTERVENSTGVATLHTSTQLVVVDVTVHDRTGRQVHGLTQGSFELREDGSAAPLRFFEEKRPPSVPEIVTPLPSVAEHLPPGVFTDLSPAPPSGPLTILLLDSLNTPLNDQAYLRAQLRDFARKVKPGSNTAIFGLGSRLYQLQGFTADPSVLRRALDRAHPAPSALLPATADSNTSATTGSEAIAASTTPPPPSPGGGTNDAQVLSTAAMVAQFEADTEAFETQVRIEDTVDAFNALGHYLENLPGRKNLLWFSGSFPLSLLPDPTAGSQAVSTFLNNELLKQTTALLSKAQVAVYPIDARGLLVNPAYDASRSGARYASPAASAQDVVRFHSGLAQEHNTEMQIAEESGGHAFFNTNSLAAAAAAAVEDGSSYYVLEYRPPPHKAEGAYHKISVSLTGAAAADGYMLSYRRGYYDASSPTAITSAPSHAAGPVRLTSAEDIYARAAMALGAPAPSDILFTVSILPSGSGKENSLAPDVKPNPKRALKPPFRRLRITFALLPKDLRLLAQTDGSHDGHVAFLAFLYDDSGNLMLSNGRELTLNLDPAKYTAFMAQPIRFAMDMDAPAGGEQYLRLGVHDLETNRFGVIEVPVSSLPLQGYAPQP